MGHTALIHLIQRKKSIFGSRRASAMRPRSRANRGAGDSVEPRSRSASSARCRSSANTSNGAGAKGQATTSGMVGETRYIYGYPFPIRQLE